MDLEDRRLHGDKLADPIAAKHCDPGFAANHTLPAVMADKLRAVTEDLTAEVITTQAQPTVDSAKALCAYQTFARFGNEISAALLLAALPQAYATTSAGILMGGGLKADPSMRLRRTAQFLVKVMMISGRAETPEDLWKADDRAAQSVLQLRALHAIIRRGVKHQHRVPQSPIPPDLQLYFGGGGNPEPINQFELLGMLLTFTIGVFEALERFGITWSRDEQDAYYHHWDVIGQYLGIDHRPELSDARRTLSEIREVEWEPINPRIGSIVNLQDEWKSLSAGRKLTRALLEDLENCMSARRRGWPLSVMRRLNPPLVCDRLALGGGGALQTLVDSMPGRRTHVDRFTSIRRTNSANSRLLRQMATTVARATLLDFVSHPSRPLEMPGLEDWSGGLPRPAGPAY